MGAHTSQELTLFGSFSDKTIEEIISQHTHNLTHLNILNSNQTEIVLQQLTTHCHKLTEFHFQNSFQSCMNSLLVSILHNNSNLTDISIICSKQLFTEDLSFVSYIAECCPRLRKLTLNNNHTLNDTHIIDIANKCHVLEYLFVTENCPLVTIISMDYAMKHCRHLNQLCVSGSSFSSSYKQMVFRKYQLVGF